jgi:rhamnulokinase
MLCQLSADAVGVPIVSGPVEASAIGNALVQARSIGVLDGGLAELRGLLTATQRLERFEPVLDDAEWSAAERRVYAD